MRFFIITALLFLIIGATSSFANEKDPGSYDRSSSPYSSSNDSSSTYPLLPTTCDDMFNNDSLDSSSATDKEVVKEVTNTQGSVRLYDDGTLLATVSPEHKSMKSIFSYISWLSSKRRDIMNIAETPEAFIARMKNGGVIIWGNVLDIDVNSVSRLYDIGNIFSNKKDVFYLHNSTKDGPHPHDLLNTLIDKSTGQKLYVHRLKFDTGVKPGIVIVERESTSTSEFYK